MDNENAVLCYLYNIPRKYKNKQKINLWRRRGDDAIAAEKLSARRSMKRVAQFTKLDQHGSLPIDEAKITTR